MALIQGKKVVIAGILLMPALFAPAQAGNLVIPPAEAAKQAIIEMMDLHEYANTMTVKLGTCIPAIQPEHPGQVACTVAVKIGAGVSETQADFYLAKGKWLAQPSVSQDHLPFPDPALQ